MTTRRSILKLAPMLAHAAMLATPVAAQEQAPASYKVKFDTSKGAFIVQVTRAWAPQGAEYMLRIESENCARGSKHRGRHVRVAAH